MKLITLTGDDGVTVQRIVSSDDWATMSGRELAALLLPSPTASDITTINEFLDNRRDGGA
jgi:hypothetical protein